jgi:hypothetical protein
VQHDVTGNIEEPMVQEGGSVVGGKSLKQWKKLAKVSQGVINRSYSNVKLATKRKASVQEVGGKGLTKKKRSGQGCVEENVIELDLAGTAVQPCQPN